MKKIGSFFFTFIPFLLALAFQYLAMFFVMGVTLRRSLEQNIRFMVHDTCKYPDHDCIFPALYRSIWLLVSCRV